MTDRSIPLAGVLGNPISQSKSPKLFRHWLRTYDRPGHYVPIPVVEGDLEQVVRTLPKMGFVGCNVTIPHKLDVLQIADLATDRATLIGEKQ